MASFTRARAGRLALTTAIGVAGAAVLTAGAGVAAAVQLARIVVTPVRGNRDDVAIRHVAADLSTVTLSRTPETIVDGRYSLWFSGDRGHLRLGPILGSTQTTVVRGVEAVSFGDPHAATTGRVAGWWYLRPEELGYPVHSVGVATANGTAPAWLFPAPRGRTRWAIHVHGRGARRQETLRGIPTFRARGYTNLVVSYRNDADAPNSADERYGLGTTEWRDVDAAIEYALGHGATQIVLVGWSMGGAIVLQTVTRSAHADAVRGVVLDSPVIDWVDTLTHQAARMHVPARVSRLALRLLGSPASTMVTGLRQPIDLAAMDFVTRADRLRVPILLLHSDGDDYVPGGPSRSLAMARPDIVTFVPFTLARHTRLWNQDRSRWVDAVDGWLRRLASNQRKPVT